MSNDGGGSPDPEQSAPRTRRSLLLVAGSGRSGTSLFTVLAGHLGYHIPLPEVRANSTNPMGFGEPRWAVDFHNELLASLNVHPEDGRPQAWELTAKVRTRPQAGDSVREWLTQQFEESDRVVVKDPRLSWFLDLYRDATRDLGVDLAVATMLRHPAESIKSRELAYGASSPSTTRMVGWVNMMLGTELATRGLPRAIVHYDRLLLDWQGTFESVLDGGLIRGATSDQLAAATATIDPSLRRAQPSWDDLAVPATVRSLAEECFRLLGQLADGAGVEPDLDDLRGRFHTLYDESADIARSSIRAARSEGRRAGRKAAEDAAAEAGAAARPPTWRRVASRVRRDVGRLRASRAAITSGPER